MSQPTPEMPTTQAEWAAHWAFYQLTVRERDYERHRYDSLLDHCDVMMNALAAGDLSDGHHTHNELYEYRMLYNAALFNQWFYRKQYGVHKSLRHHTGEFCFGTEKESAGWFIVVATLPEGQISNHYKVAEAWDLFHCPEQSLPDPYDGHTPAEAARRLREHLTIKPETCRAQRWNAEPCYMGDHPGHFFHYGKGGEYQGWCGGWPKREGIKF